MNRFASTRSEKRDMQPLPGRAQCSVGSIDDDGIRYGLTTQALIASTIAIAPRIVTPSRWRCATGAASPCVRTSMGFLRTLLARLCSRRHSAIRSVVAREQDVGHLPAPELGRASVVRVLEAAFELGGEALLARPTPRSERARQPTRDRVQEHHRRQLAAREDVRADRDRIRGQMLDDALVEALEPRGEQRHVSSPASSSTSS